MFLLPVTWRVGFVQIKPSLSSHIAVFISLIKMELTKKTIQLLLVEDILT